MACIIIIQNASCSKQEHLITLAFQELQKERAKYYSNGFLSAILSIKISPFGARLIKSPARRVISSSDEAEKSYSALATTWSSSPLAQLVAKRRRQKLIQFW